MNRLKHDFAKIDIPKDLQHRVELGVQQAKEEMKLTETASSRIKWSPWKKLTFISLSIVLIFSLMFSSVFVSPAMAHVVSKIPYLNQFFQSKDIASVIQDHLKKKHFNIYKVGMQYQPDKSIIVTVQGSERYYNNVKSKIEKNVLHDLQIQGFNAYKVHVVMKRTPHTKEDPDKNQTRKFLLAISQALVQYPHVSVQIWVADKQFQVEMPSTEKRTRQIKQIVSNIAKENNMADYSIAFHTFNLEKRELSQRWSPLIDAINDGLTAKKDYHVSGLAFSNDARTMTINIKTYLKSSDQNIQETVGKIKNEIQQLLDSKQAKTIIKAPHYKILILDKDKRQIGELRGEEE